MSFSYEFNPTILREYDVRGIVDKNLKSVDCLALGRAFGTFVARAGGTKVGLCYDGRASSPEFTAQLIEGLCLSGLNVEDFGLGPTPLAYFGLHHRDLDAVMIVTGSHNPPEYNGIKMALKSGPVYGDMIQELGRMAKEGDIIQQAMRGRQISLDIKKPYIERLCQDYNAHGKPPLTVVWDAGNGAVGAVLSMLTNALPGHHTLLYDTVDGTFPNHHPDPAVEKNLVDLKKTVLEKNADLGIAFDGDGDRIGVVTRQGDIIWSDQLIALYARDILDRKPQSTIILDVKCSDSISTLIKGWGGKPIIWKAGHSLVKAKMQETHAVLGGELSGHIFFKEGFYGHDDALYCAIRLLNIIQKYGDLTTLKKSFPVVYNTPELRLDVPEEDKFAIISRAKTSVEKNIPHAAILDIDGIRVSNEHGWWLLRASNTQNALTMRVESPSQEGLLILIVQLEQALIESGCIFTKPLF